MSNTEKRLARIEEKLDEVSTRIANLEGQYSLSTTLIKWIIFPLIMILGGITGVKVILPNLG